MSTLSERIIFRLEQIGKTPARASSEAGLGNTAIRDIITGKSKAPTLATIEALCEPLECSLGYLVGVEEQTKANEHPPLAKFWMVHGINQRPPAYKHWTFESAEREARRLSVAHPGVVFVVLEAVTAFASETPRTVEISVDVNADDGIPF
ncbi:DNA-binding Xre family transcriptional regulator [Pseudorhizobium tarimense]|uniref:DNA-binding Xre family transcriptional regulator n=1 Tax=Pseudorhizobium tarimense TaxID=1079109 RepID=A0ABV2H5F5_9HYPH|nr:helix-turn-helix transcriptional regulator [Pseudorhizobium tarimense]MCJ8518983.1 helix-turn-helix domain-containing protein [Pseudorhizobium tarimense]